MFKDELEQAAAEYGLALFGSQLDTFQKYYELLIDWNKRVNLTRITGEREVAVKHMIDSLAAWDSVRFPKDARLLDIGAGAGFPSIPLKIFQPQLDITLLDSAKKRILFLEETVNALKLENVVCIHARAEDAAHDPQHREQYDIVTARAVARLNVLAEYALPFVKPGGWFAALKGKKYLEETKIAAGAIELLGGGEIDLAPIKLPGFDEGRAIIYAKKIASTPPKYPRKAGIPEKKPLVV